MENVGKILIFNGKCWEENLILNGKCWEDPDFKWKMIETSLENAYFQWKMLRKSMDNGKIIGNDEENDGNILRK